MRQGWQLRWLVSSINKDSMKKNTQKLVGVLMKCFNLSVKRTFRFIDFSEPASIFFSFFPFFDLCLLRAELLIGLSVRLQIPLFSEQDNFLLKRGLRIIF